MPNWAIEIHDSEIDSIAVIGDYVVLNFSSAYIHESEGRPGFDEGSGWTQRTSIVFISRRLRLPLSLARHPVWPLAARVQCFRWDRT